MKLMLKLSLFSLVFAVAVFAEQPADSHTGVPTGAPIAQADASQSQAPIDELAVYQDRYNQCMQERVKQRSKSPSSADLALIKLLGSKQ